LQIKGQGSSSACLAQVAQKVVLWQHEQAERSADMVVFMWRPVIVQHGQIAVCLDQKVVRHALVPVIMHSLWASQSVAAKSG
jgi:hypothetical protein